MRVRMKKSQAALEFLATYGWAFLVIIIMIGTLAYFGILSPSKLLPDRCNFGSELACRAFTIAKNGVNLRLSNNVGEAIIVSAISVASEKQPLSCTSPIIGAVWKSGEVKDVPVSCSDFANSGLTAGEKGKLNLKLAYYAARSSSSFSKDVNGEVYAVVGGTLVGGGTAALWSLDEGSGTIANDWSGNGNNGNLLNGPTWVTGKKGNALSFDGTNDYIDIPNSATINPTNSITVMAWVKSASFTYNTAWSIVSKYSAYILGPPGFSTKDMCFIIYNSAGWQYGSCYAPVDVTQWHHFAGTYDSSTGQKKLYVNGVLQSTTTPGGTINPDTGPLSIGERECCDQYFNGIIDEVKIYNRALTPEEILVEYNS